MQQPALFDPEPDATYTVGELGRAVRRALDVGFPAEVWVRGEIRGLAPPGDGRRLRPHLYFDLIECGARGADRPEALLPVVLWATDRKRVNGELRAAGVGASAMDSGVEVRIRGRLRWWAPGGRIQFQMTGIDPTYTLGRLVADRARLLAALSAEGLLDRNAALTMPALPLRVGLVTSLASAAHADVLDELTATGLAFHVIEVDARVQGPATAHSVPAALATAARAGVDVILLVRGGGSPVELAAFDLEPVARAVATCPVPVITGIGHDIDDSVADAVAHTAAKTPTAAAARVVDSVREAHDRAEARWLAVAQHAVTRLTAGSGHLATTARRAASLTGSSLRAAGAGLDDRERRLERSAPAAVRGARRRVDGCRTLVVRDARRDVLGADRRLAAATDRLARTAPAVVARSDRALDGVAARVRANDPARALARGWSVTYGADGTVIRSVDAVGVGDELETVLADGRLRTRVTAAEADTGAMDDER